MKKLVFALLVFSVLTLNAQNYQITFTGTGASTTVNTVKVENLTAGTSLTLNGSDILRLTFATAINSPIDYQSSDIKIYPNPMTDYTTLEIFPPLSGNAVISINEITGKPVYKVQTNLENLRKSYKIAGLKTGIYLVSIKGNGYQFSGKLVSNGNPNGQVRIEEINSITQSVKLKKSESESKGSAAIIDMLYTDGDRLKFTGASGNYRTIITDIPSSDKNINFDFVACIDGDYNIYPVVKIGTQTWMAENLKTTRYNDGITAIPNVTDNATWSTTTSGAYCDYQNTPTYSTTYGRLYNWYTVASTNTKNACPTGWHVPTDVELTTLQTFLGGEIVAGGKLKETGTAHWLTPNTSATNEKGFTALPGGYRIPSGTFGLMGNTGYWWSSTQENINYAWYFYIYYGNANLTELDHEKHCGSSVRCLED
jgi:uncharacterized protein (TIGR02145 family)